MSGATKYLIRIIPLHPCYTSHCANDFEIIPPPKRVRENTFYTVRMKYFKDATTDDNEAYVKSKNTKKNYYIQYGTERQK